MSNMKSKYYGSKKIKVLYLTSTLQKSGPTNQLLYIIRNLSSQFEPVVITLSPEPDNSLKKTYENFGIRVKSLGLSRLSGLFFLKKAFLELLNKENPDIIHSQGFRADVLSGSIKGKHKKVCTIRNFPQLDFKMTYGAMLSYYMCLKQKNILRKFDAVCGVSKSVTNNICDLYNVKKVFTIYNGVDMKRYTKQDENSYLRSSLGIPSNSIVWITSLGKDKRKNSLTLLKGFIPFLKENPNHYLIFVGDGEQRYECECISKDIVNINFLGKVDNIESYLSISDYFVSASLAEGMPNAVLEALSCRLPSVLSNIPPHLEIEHVGLGGVFTFDVNDEISLYNCLKSIDYDNKNNQSEIAFETVKSNFDSVGMSRNYQKLYLNILEG